MGSVAAFRVSQIDHSAPTDQELIERTLAGDGGAFAILVERFQRKIYRVAYAIVRDDMEADTITQDTFIQAYTHLGRFEGRAERFFREFEWYGEALRRARAEGLPY